LHAGLYLEIRSQSLLIKPPLNLLEIIWFGHFFFQSGALLGRTKSIPHDKTTIALPEIICFGHFFFQSRALFSF
jgi:hypothetical protein